MGIWVRFLRDIRPSGYLAIAAPLATLFSPLGIAYGMFFLYEHLPLYLVLMA